MSHGKKWKEMAAKVDREKLYDPAEAVGLVKEVSYSSFEGTVDVSVKVQYKSLQSVRGLISLPNGTGKEVRVLVFCREDKVAEAKAAGADFVGGVELVEKIQKESWTDFDACVASPDMMKDVGKLGPVLGRKGLMPKPKAGTVTPDVAGAVKKLKGGQTEYRPDKTGVIHLRIGKVGFDSDKLIENVKAFYGALLRDKPADAKGDFIKSFSISPTMGPGIKISTRSLAKGQG